MVLEISQVVRWKSMDSAMAEAGSSSIWVCGCYKSTSEAAEFDIFTSVDTSVERWDRVADSLTLRPISVICLLSHMS